MIYLKTEVNGVATEVEVYADEFYSTCPICGKEVKVDEETLKIIFSNDLDFSGTCVWCPECTRKRTTKKAMKENKGLILTTSQLENQRVLTKVINQVKDEDLKDELFIALDLYNQLVFNDLTDVCTNKLG